MSAGEVRKVSCDEIQQVQNLIEKCLRLYMTQKEVVDTLLAYAKIEPDFTVLVWQKLEEENREFFKAYHLRLIVKDQIMQFNRLLERQVELMHCIRPAEVASVPVSNGAHIPPLNQNSVCYAPEHNCSLPNTFPNGGLSLHQCMQNPFDMSSHVRRIDGSPNTLLARNSNVGTIQGMNGGMIKLEGGYAGSSPYMFGTDGNVLDAHPPITDVSHPLNVALLDAHSDLTADFSNSPDILGSYSRSPFLAADADFLDLHGRGEDQGDNRSLGCWTQYQNA